MDGPRSLGIVAEHVATPAAATLASVSDNPVASFVNEAIATGVSRFTDRAGFVLDSCGEWGMVAQALL